MTRCAGKNGPAAAAEWGAQPHTGPFFLNLPYPASRTFVVFPGARSPRGALEFLTSERSPMHYLGDLVSTARAYMPPRRLGLGRAIHKRVFCGVQDSLVQVRAHI